MGVAPTRVFPRGIVPSMNTPFLADGTVDLEAVRRSAEVVIGDGVAGLLVLAVAAETGSLNLDEKRAIAGAFIAQAAGRVPVIVGCSSARQPERLALAAMARELGAPAMLCQVPEGLRGEALLAQMAELAEAGPDVLMVQDLDFGGPGLPLADILLLHERLPAFRCLKIEAALPGPKYTAVLQATQGRLHVSGGWAAAQMLEALQRGVHAFIPTAMEPIYVEIHRRFVAGDVAGARALHQRLTPVLAFSNQHIDVSIRFFKALRHRQGLFRTDICRPPVAPLDAWQQAELEVNVERALALERELRTPGFNA
jgi:dihydrodipicolinate synthase/N-acetylneuraminate lyase